MLSYVRSNPLLTTDPSAVEVRRLRVEEQLSVAQLQARSGIGRNRLQHRLRGLAADRFQATTCKRHRVDTYPGRLMIEVPRSRYLYWEIEGSWRASVLAPTKSSVKV
ncbi:hypothetical protein ACLQ24_01670 [Micromonospora sp. DT4]|uniref:hypothetical protein n=1 Tax=Micromonospora sp. DT4 TaxID=3393438 RepID=UPI003CF2C52B